MEGASNNARTPAQNPTSRNAKALVAEFRCPTTLALAILAESPRYVVLLADRSLRKTTHVFVQRLRQLSPFELTVHHVDAGGDCGTWVCSRLRDWPDIGEVVVLADGPMALECVPSVIVASAPPWGYRTVLAWVNPDGTEIWRCSFDRGMMTDQSVVPLLHPLPIHTLVSLRGGVIQQGYLSAQTEAGQKALARLDLARKFVNRSCHSQPVLVTDPTLRQETAAALGLIHIMKEPRAAKAIDAYLNGMWLEEYCWAIMERSGLFDEVYGQIIVGSLFGLPNDGGTSCSREFDVLARRGNRIIVVECKSGKVDYNNCGLGRLHVAQYLFGPLVHMMYVTTLPNSQSAQGMASHLGFDVVSLENLLSFEEYLRACFGERTSTNGGCALLTSCSRLGRLQGLVDSASRRGEESSRNEAGDSNKGGAQRELEEWCRQRGLPAPRYRDVSREGPPHSPIYTAHAVVNDRVWGVGRGGKVHIARTRAALDALRFISAACRGDQTPVGQKSIRPTAEAIECLQRYCAEKGCGRPEYVEHRSGPPHQLVFNFQVFVGGKMVGMGEGKRKREAQTLAALRALQTLRTPASGRPAQSGTKGRP